jgi:hypothetical protein
MDHPLAENAARCIRDLIKFYPGHLTEARLPGVFLESNMWDRTEYDAGLCYAENQGWVRRARGRIRLTSAGRNRAT